MKKVVFACLALALILAACAPPPAQTDPGPAEQPLAPAALQVAPLLQTAAESGSETTLLPTREGVVALWGRGGGFTGVWVSGTKSALTEDLIAGVTPPERAAFLETETGKGVLCAGGRGWYLLLDGSGGEEKTLPDGVRFTGVLYGGEGFICEKEGLLLLVPADLSAPLVLADGKKLPDFGGILTATDHGGRLWYAQRDAQGRGVGLAAFVPGESRVTAALPVSFESAVSAGDGRLLLSRKEGEGRAFILLDPETKESAALTVPGETSLFTLSPDGSILALWDGAAGQVRLFAFEDGRETAAFDPGDLGTPSALRYGGDGALYVTLRQDAGEILATLDGAG